MASGNDALDALMAKIQQMEQQMQSLQTQFATSSAGLIPSAQAATDPSHSQTAFSILPRPQVLLWCTIPVNTVQGGGNNILWDTVKYDPCGMRSPTITSRVYVPVSGFYTVTAAASFNSAFGTYRQVELILNGGVAPILDAIVPPSNGNSTIPVIAGVVFLNLGDYVEVRTFQDQPGPATVRVPANVYVNGFADTYIAMSLFS